MNTNPTIVRKVDIPSTLLAIETNETVKFRARAFAPYGSVRSAITRLNAGYDEPNFTCSTDDNGETFTVTRGKY